MSMQTWSNQGYGFVASDIHTDVNKVWKLIHLAPKFEKQVNKWFQNNFDCKKEDITLENFTEDFYDKRGSMCGVATILANVISECENIIIVDCFDWDDNTYVIRPNAQPWDFSEHEAYLSQYDLDCIFDKYISILTDEEIDIDYQVANNCG